MYNKYHAQKVTYDGRTFDSKHEMQRYQELKLLERGKAITDLKCQVKYELIPAQYETINGKRTCVERACAYIADFVYTDKLGNTVVEDAKGLRIEPYITKRKLMLYRHGIRVREV